MFANDKHEEAYNLAKDRKLDEALILFNEALLTSPDNPDIYSDRGVLFIHMKNKVAALNDFNKAIDLQPDYSYRYSARAYAHDFFGDTNAAISDYEKAIDLDPQDAVAYNNLGLVQEKLGYKKMAEGNFERADKLAKQEEKLHELMHDLEENDDESNTEIIEEESSFSDLEAEKNQRETIVPIENKEPSKSVFKEFSKLFTSKEQFKSFLKFLKNGFRIK